MDSEQSHGEEQANPILEHIRNTPYAGQPSGSLEPSNQSKMYQLWNAAKLQAAVILDTPEAQEWFGHSLFTTAIKLYISHEWLATISNVFSPNPEPPLIGSNQVQFASYAASPSPYSDPELQIQRYSSLSTFHWNLAAALDVLMVGLDYLFKFEKLKQQFHIQRTGDIRPLRIDFATGVSFLQNLHRIVGADQKPQELLRVFEDEGLLAIRDPQTHSTECDWYEDLRLQRNYHTHVGFPFLYVADGQWYVARDPRQTADSLVEVPTLCHRLFDNVHHFINQVYGATWAYFAILLP